MWKSVLRIIYTHPRWFPLVGDAAAWPAGIAISLTSFSWLGGGDLIEPFGVSILIACAAAVTQIVAGLVTGSYRRRWRIASFHEVVGLGMVWLLGLVVALAIASPIVFDISRRLVLLAALITLSLDLVVRTVWRYLWEAHTRRSAWGRSGKRALVAGTGDGANSLLRSMLASPDGDLIPVGLLANDPGLRFRELQGVPVRGRFEDLPELISTLRVDCLIVTSDLVEEDRAELLDIVAGLGIDVVGEAQVADSLSLHTHADLRPAVEAAELGVVESLAATPIRRAQIERSDTQQRRSTRIPVLLVGLGDVLALHAAILLAFVVRFRSFRPPEKNIEGYVSTAPFLTAGFIFLMFSFDLYAPRKLPTRLAVRRLARPLTLLALLGTTLMSLVDGFGTPRTVILLGSVFGGVFVLVWRGLVYNVENRATGSERVIVVFDARGAETSDQRESLRRVEAMSADHVAVFGMYDYRDVDAIYAAAAGVDRVIVTAAVPSADRGRLIVDLVSAGVSVFLIPDTLDLALSTAQSTVFHTLEGIELSDGLPSPFWAFSKRLVDGVVSLAMLIVSGIPMVVIALAVRFDSAGPVLFRQRRVGLGGQYFEVIKFRTMHQNAEADTGAVLAVENDPRITRVGRFLRKTHLDELPQLVNVLLGDMSLVGPRPERPEFVKEHLEKVNGYSRRFRVRPGMTGLAQVRAGYSATVEEKTRFDLLYIGDMHLFADLRIGIQTIATMLDFSASSGVPPHPEPTIDLVRLEKSEADRPTSIDECRDGRVARDS